MARRPQPPAYRDRIVDVREMPLAELTANPHNWRRHGQEQAAALSDVLREVGIVQTVVYNRSTGRLVDGHLRVRLARERGEKNLRATIVELTEPEEQAILASLDPLAMMADADERALDDLIRKADLADKPYIQALSLGDGGGGEDDHGLNVEEIPTSDVADIFFIQITGPLKQQAFALQRLRSAMADLGDVEVNLGLTHRDEF